MKTNSYHRTIIVNAHAIDVTAKISEVKWWKKDFTGSAEKLNQKFTVPFGELNGEISFVDFVVSEFLPSKKIVWKVIDCNLPWFKDKKEWQNTEVIFELAEENNKTKIDFTHNGLIPEVECYEVCESGWNGHIMKDLVKYIEECKHI